MQNYFFSRLLVVLIAAAWLPLMGCADETQSELLDNATAATALSEGEGEPLSEVPGGDEGAGAEEGVAELEEGASMHWDCSFDAVRERVRAHYDEDADGEIGESEEERLREDFGERPPRRSRFAKAMRFMRLRWVYDADDSHSLDDDERAELKSDLEARCEARQEKLILEFDGDGDGGLSDEEWQIARQTIGDRIRDRRHETRAEFDTDGDGQLSDDERRAAHDAMGERMGGKRERLIAEFDADGDGELSDEEKQAARESIRARIRMESVQEA